MQSDYEYIVVGGGSGGVAMAARLSQAGKRTLLIEAGRRRGNWLDSWMVDMPAGYPYAFTNKNFNWAYEGEPEPHLGNRKMYQPRGKVLGGSSSINGMGWLRPNPLDMARWVSEGAKGWSFSEVLPYLKRIETWEGKPSQLRGMTGPIHARTGTDPCPYYGAFIEAGKQAGFGTTEDVNGEVQEGFGAFQMNVDSGIRSSTAHGYLRDVADHGYLTIVSQAHASRILLTGTRATGVEYLAGGATHQAHAASEVILACGAFNSPQVLMLSGIGPAVELQSHGIKTVVDLPGVGQGLQDHPLIYAKYEATKAVSPIKYERLDRKIAVGLQWLLTRTGPGATNYMETIAMIRSDPSVKHPDIEFQYYPLVIDHDAGYVKGIHGWTNCIGPVRVDSRGWVKLRSADPLAPPRIMTNLLATDSDMTRMRRSIEINRDVMNQPAYREFLKGEIDPSPKVTTGQEMRDYIRANTNGDFHPVGTCKMGEGDMAVVDNALRVRGVQNLRIADASIMPSIVSANTNVTSIMIGDRGADIVLGKCQV